MGSEFLLKLKRIIELYKQLHQEHYYGTVTVTFADGEMTFVERNQKEKL